MTMRLLSVETKQITLKELFQVQTQIILKHLMLTLVLKALLLLNHTTELIRKVHLVYQMNYHHGHRTIDSGGLHTQHLNSNGTQMLLVLYQMLLQQLKVEKFTIQILIAQKLVALVHTDKTIVQLGSIQITAFTKCQII